MPQVLSRADLDTATPGDWYQYTSSQGLTKRVVLDRFDPQGIPVTTVEIEAGAVGYGDVLPTAATTAFELFHLHDQATTQFNGLYRRVGTTHWRQTLAQGAVGGTPAQTIDVGATLPAAGSTVLSAYLLHSQIPATLNGWYINAGTHWIQTT